MNYFITHCDEKYLKYAERLFESLKTYSSNKIIFFTVGFDYESKFDNVISIKFNLDDYFSNISHGELNKDFFVGYSPERANPGDKTRKLENITKVISGSNTKTLKIIHRV